MPMWYHEYMLYWLTGMIATFLLGIAMVAFWVWPQPKSKPDRSTRTPEWEDGLVPIDVVISSELPLTIIYAWDIAARHLEESAKTNYFNKARVVTPAAVPGAWPPNGTIYVQPSNDTGEWVRIRRGKDGRICAALIGVRLTGLDIKDSLAQSQLKVLGLEPPT